MSSQCINCGDVLEIDGIDDTTDNIREAVINQYGLWGLFITSKKELSKIEYIVKKDSRFFSIKNNIAFIKTDTSNKLFEGTNQEMIWIKSILSQKGISSLEIKKVWV